MLGAFFLQRWNSPRPPQEDACLTALEDCVIKFTGKLKGWERLSREQQSYRSPCDDLEELCGLAERSGPHLVQETIGRERRLAGGPPERLRSASSPAPRAFPQRPRISFAPASQKGSANTYSFEFFSLFQSSMTNVQIHSPQSLSLAGREPLVLWNYEEFRDHYFRHILDNEEDDAILIYSNKKALLGPLYRYHFYEKRLPARVFTTPQFSHQVWNYLFKPSEHMKKQIVGTLRVRKKRKDLVSGQGDSDSGSAADFDAHVDSLALLEREVMRMLEGTEGDASSSSNPSGNDDGGRVLGRQSDCKGTTIENLQVGTRKNLSNDLNKLLSPLAASATDASGRVLPHTLLHNYLLRVTLSRMLNEGKEEKENMKNIAISDRFLHSLKNFTYLTHFISLQEQQQYRTFLNSLSYSINGNQNIPTNHYYLHDLLQEPFIAIHYRSGDAGASGFGAINEDVDKRTPLNNVIRMLQCANFVEADLGFAQAVDDLREKKPESNLRPSICPRDHDDPKLRFDISIVN